MNARSLISVLLSLALWPVASDGADPAAFELQRLRLQRAQQQSELQLRMQQSNRAALTPPATVAERLELNALELGQRWRLQQLHREQLQRELALRAVPETSGTASQRHFEILRAEQEGQAQLERFRWESSTQGWRGTAVPRSLSDSSPKTP